MLLDLLALGPAQVPAIAQLSVVETTRRVHLAMLNLISTNLSEDLRQLPAADAIVETLMRRRKSQRWRWSTTLKNFASAQGAISSLALYRKTPVTIRLQSSPVWRAAMIAVARKSRAELPRQPRPVNWAEVQAVLRTETDDQTFAAILLAWMSCARVGCVLSLHTSDVTVHTDMTCSVRFRHGKGVLARGQAYTIHCAAIPAEFQSRFLTYLGTSHGPIFAGPSLKAGEKVKLALRRAHPDLEQRSLRRGALQHLAKAPGMTDAMLMLFSGHSRVETLRRYLSWGVAAAHTRAAMATAGRVLVA
jgi:integrase